MQHAIMGTQKTRKLLTLIRREKRGDDLFSRSSSSLVRRLSNSVTQFDISLVIFFNVLRD